jgi:hypothetical protein
MWGLKLLVCIVYDLFDFTIGRLMFATPFVGEFIGGGICAAMFGWSGVFYGLEGLDFTEQLDGLIPAATIIALRDKPA